MHRPSFGLFRRSRTGGSLIESDARTGSAEPLREALSESAASPWVVRSRTRVASMVVGGGVAVFGILAWVVSSGLTAEPDLALSRGVQQAQHPLIAAVMALVSYFGFQPQSIIIVFGSAALLWLAGKRLESFFAVLGAIGIGIMGTALKLVWLRPRPEEGVVQVLGSVAGYSFPSGHVLHYVSFFGFLLYWAYTSLKKGHLRTAMLWSCGLLIALVGPSRVYLGHHWSSDVLAAYALGLAYLFVIVRVYDGILRRGERRHALRD